MKQIIQSFKTGETLLEELPVPKVGKGQLLIRTVNSLVSLGTERMLVEFGKASLIQKARQQPEKVQMVLDKIKAEGLLPTIETVFKKLGQPLPLGYCNAGIVEEVGAGVSLFKVGDRVISNGNHAEFVCVAQNLCAKIPDNVSFEEASFTVIGSIGLQGIRLLHPTLGETVVVIGLGLIGLITAQLLLANGCQVIGIDIDQSKLDIAEKYGVKVINPNQGDIVKFVESLTSGVGADGVIITASSKSHDIIKQSAQMSRKRGKIVLVGVIGLQLNRSDFYEKELSFQVSCSYGPGRYDVDYEEKGIDYPLSYVRWTEQRNFEAILQAISSGSLNVLDLITERVGLSDYQKIYSDMRRHGSIASILNYNQDTQVIHKVKTSNKIPTYRKGAIAIVGAGNFTKMTMLPLLKEAPIKYIISKGGLNAKDLAKKYDIEYSATDIEEALNDDDVTLMMITTRHDLHADMVVKSIMADKSVFVEKPLALTSEELQRIQDALIHNPVPVMVGFNRRFSPHIQKIKELVPESSPKNIIATMNAGYIPAEVWVHDIEIGGGRIIGEACHYIDLLSFISGSLVTSICMSANGLHPKVNTDNASILLKFENGDTGVINYFSNGSKAYSKERVEVYWDEKTIIMDNFRETRAFGVKGFKKLKTKMDKGHENQFNAIVSNLENNKSVLIPFSSILNTSKASLACIDSLVLGTWIHLADEVH